MTDAVVEESVSQCLSNSITNAKKETYPFDHWEVKGLLEESIRVKMLDIELPAPVNFKYDGTRAGDAKDRSKESIPPKRLFIGKEEIKKYPYFKELKDALLSRAFLDLVKSKFSLDTKGLYLRLEYINDFDGFYLHPHKDIGEKKLTLLLYLNNGPEYMGTDFYDNDIKLVKTIKFGANRGYAFIPGSDTWHGLEKKPISGRRVSLLINYVSFKTDWPVPDENIHSRY